jgi:hypothetical protein
MEITQEAITSFHKKFSLPYVVPRNDVILVMYKEMLILNERLSSILVM